MVIVLPLVVSVGFLNNSIAISAQDFGASDIVAINSVVSDATVNFIFDFQNNNITHCSITTFQILAEGYKLRCQLMDENGSKITQGTTTTDGITNSYLVSLNQAQLIDDVENIKVILIGNSNNSNTSSDGTLSSSSTGDTVICHIEGNSQSTKSVSASALNGHLGHGDYLGPCQ